MATKPHVHYYHGGSKEGHEDFIESELKRWWPAGYTIHHLARTNCSCSYATAKMIWRKYILPDWINGDLDSYFDKSEGLQVGIIPSRERRAAAKAADPAWLPDDGQGEIPPTSSELKASGVDPEEWLAKHSRPPGRKPLSIDDTTNAIREEYRTTDASLDKLAAKYRVTRAKIRYAIARDPKVTKQLPTVDIASAKPIDDSTSR